MTDDDSASLSRIPSHHRTLKAAIAAGARQVEINLNDVEGVDVETYVLGVEALESPEAFANWLCTPSAHLNNQTPISRLRTDAGRQDVRRLLVAIEYGVYL